MSNYHIKSFEEYFNLYRKSVRNPELFWEEVEPVENKEVEPIRTRQELRPAPKAVSTVKPVEKTEKTVE